MSSKILFFTGAPESSSLSWDEANLLNDFNETVLQFAGLAGHTNTTSAVHEATASEHPSWRSIPLEKQHLTSGFSQDHGWQPEYQGTSFFTTSDITSFVEEETYVQTGGSFGPSTQSAEEVLSQFYEKSYAIHEDIPSSQIPADSGQKSVSCYSNGASFEATESYYDSQFQSALQSFPRPREVPVAPVVGRLHSLNEIPNAVYLNSIQPQTMTVNLIVGIISLPAPRPIKTRHGAAVELVEVLVGDETKSGFAINFWLSSDRSAEGSLRGILGGLRPQDVILVRNVALSSFRGRVYGQSLRKEMTKVHLMYRNRLDKTDPGGCYTSEDISTGEAGDKQLEKTRSVRDWVFRFVGVAEGGQKTRREKFETAKEVLPPDTP